MYYLKFMTQGEPVYLTIKISFNSVKEAIEYIKEKDYFAFLTHSKTKTLVVFNAIVIYNDVGRTWHEYLLCDEINRIKCRIWETSVFAAIDYANKYLKKNDNYTWQVSIYHPLDCRSNKPEYKEIFIEQKGE